MCMCVCVCIRGDLGISLNWKRRRNVKARHSTLIKLKENCSITHSCRCASVCHSLMGFNADLTVPNSHGSDGENTQGCRETTLQCIPLDSSGAAEQWQGRDEQMALSECPAPCV